MRRRFINRVAAFTVLALVGVVGLHGEGGETKKAPTYATPQAVFDAAKKAAAKNDYRAVLGTLSEDNRDAFAGMMVILGSFAKQAAPFAKTDEEKAKIKKIDEVLDSHGVTAEMAQSAMALAKDLKGKLPAELLPAMRKLIQPVKDRAGLVAEMMILSAKDKGNPFEELKAAQLKDVKIEGDKASGTVTTTKDGMEKTDPIEFRKEGAGWRIHIDLTKKK